MHIHKAKKHIYFRNYKIMSSEYQIGITNNIHHSTFTSTHNAHILYMTSKYFRQ